MRRYLPYISLLLLSSLFSDEIIVSGDAAPITLHTQSPEVNVTYPNQQSFDQGEIITITWSASDTYFPNNPIDILLSTSASNLYDLVASNLENTGEYTLILPYINTQYGRIKVVAVDSYGYEGYDVSNGYFTIGDTDDFTQIDSTLTIQGDAPFTILDTKPPTVHLTYPNGGQSFDEGESVNVTWTADDEHFLDDPIDILLSTTQTASFESMANNLENTGLHTTILPYIITEYGRFKVHAEDSYGNVASDISNGYFTIGEVEEFVYLDTSIVVQGDSPFTNLDTEDPSITVIYPNGGEFIENPQNVNLEWSVSDVELETATISASVASGLGGWYVLIATELPVFGDINSYDVSMSAVEQTLWARVEMEITDDFGNTGSDRSDGYFILGNPEGELDTEWLSEEENIIALDWGWQVGQLIAIYRTALTFLEPEDVIEVVDMNGILTESCGGPTGELVLSSTVYSGQEVTIGLKALAGGDNCSEGGSRYDGYVEGNDIVIRYIDASQGGEVITLTPDLDMVSGSLNFDNGITVISGFANTEGRQANRTQNFNPLTDNSSSVAIGDRDFDSYNIYRATNQVNMRECTDTAGCTLDSDNICVCLIANNVSETYYFDNYSAPTEQEGWCYDVWLLNNDDEEILKTVDSCMDVDLDLLFGDVNVDGTVNILDIVLLMAYIMDTASLDGQGLVQADFNQDGVVNVLDIVAIIDLILNGS